MPKTSRTLALRCAAPTLTVVLGLIAPLSAVAMGAATGHNAFFRPPVNVSRSPDISYLAHTSPRSLVLDPAGPAYFLWVETLTHTQGTAHELAMCHYMMGKGWDSTLTRVGRWDGESSTEPAAAIDHHRVLHVVWLEQTAKGRLVMGFRFDTATERVSDPLAISEAGGNAGDPAIATDPHGRVHVVWSEIEAGRPGLRHRDSDGVLWGPASAVPAGPDASVFSPDLACDVAGVLHLAWTQSAAGTNVPMYARRTPDREWGKPERLADQRPGWYTGPPVLCASGDRVWVAWAENDGKEGRVVVRTRTHDGWSRAFSPSRANVLAEQPSAAVDAWGTFHLVWLERASSGDPTAATTTNSIVYSSCAPGDSMFAVPRSLTTAGGGLFESPVLAADSSGRVIAAWIDRGRGTGDIVSRHGVAGFTLPTSGLAHSR